MADTMPGAPIACLPWYALPELASAEDALFAAFAGHCRRRGLTGAPARLTRPVDIPAVLADPRLFLGQCCGYDVVYGFSGVVRPLAAPVFDLPGCDGPAYRSLVLVRDDSVAETLGDLRGGVCAVNSFNSHSGANAIRPLVAPLAEKGRFFARVVRTGSHLRSLALLRAGRADAMAMDCILHGLLRAVRPAALAGARILCETAAAPAPPFVTAAARPADDVARLRAALADCLADPATAGARAALRLAGSAPVDVSDYAPILDFEAAALARGYHELHAVSPALETG